MKKQIWAGFFPWAKDIWHASASNEGMMQMLSDSAFVKQARANTARLKKRLKQGQKKKRS